LDKIKFSKDKFDQSDDGDSKSSSPKDSDEENEKKPQLKKIEGVEVDVISSKKNWETECIGSE